MEGVTDGQDAGDIVPYGGPQCSLIPSISIDPFFLSICCSGPQLLLVMSSLPPELAGNVHITSHLGPPRPNTCNGRLVCLDTLLSLAEALQRTKRHLKMEYFRLVLRQGRNLFSVMGKVAVCGSGASVLAGEMSHHEVLDIVHKGTSIIMADYSNTERGFLQRAKSKIEGLCEGG